MIYCLLHISKYMGERRTTQPRSQRASALIIIIIDPSLIGVSISSQSQSHRERDKSAWA